MRRIIGEIAIPEEQPAGARRPPTAPQTLATVYCLQRGAMMEAMKIDLSDEVVKLIVEALEHYCAGCEYSSF